MRGAESEDSKERGGRIQTSLWDMKETGRSVLALLRSPHPSRRSRKADLNGPLSILYNTPSPGTSDEKPADISAIWRFTMWFDTTALSRKGQGWLGKNLKSWDFFSQKVQSENKKKKKKNRAEQLAEGLKVEACTEKAVCRGHEAIKVRNEQKL